MPVLIHVIDHAMLRDMLAQRWDAVVVGASFAGLAAARALAGVGRVLLLDRGPVGWGQTSACATPLAALERLGLLDSVEQVHDLGVVHFGDDAGHPFPLGQPFATFDYRRCCVALLAQTDAHFLQATALGRRDEVVLTSAGAFSAHVVIDASGWRSVLAPSPGRRQLSLGLEVRLGGGGDGLHFWLQHPAAHNGYAWDFPAGDHRRVGLLTYGESRGLHRRLKTFLGEPVPAGGVHGGGLPARLRDPVAGTVFLVGDAAGQCLPLTGEGIRPALVYGHLAGYLARQVLCSRLSQEQALCRYREAVRAARREYEFLRLLQVCLGPTPRLALKALCWLLGVGPLSRLARSQYWAAAPLGLLELAYTRGDARIHSPTGPA